MLIKALRPQSGAYGSIDAGGVIDIDSDEATALKVTGNWTDAKQEDLEAAKTRQERFVADAAAQPVGPRWAATGGTLADPMKPVAVQAAEANAEHLVQRAKAAAAEASAAQKTVARATATAELDAKREAELAAAVAQATDTGQGQPQATADAGSTAPKASGKTDAGTTSKSDADAKGKAQDALSPVPKTAQGGTEGAGTTGAAAPTGGNAR